MLTRRHLIRSAAAAGAISALPVAHTAAQTPETTTSTYEPIAKIGDTREVFDSEYGVGREENGWVSYGEDDRSTAFYNVLFNADGLAETIEIDFRHLEGGFPAEGNIGISRFVPDDGEIGTEVIVGAYRADDPYYGVWQWHSPSLAEATGRSGNVIVMDALTYAGPDLGTVISHTMISMETFQVNELVPSGEEYGPHSGLDAWEHYSGERRGSFGLSFTNGPVPGDWMATDHSVSVVPNPPLSVSEANDLVGSMMREGDIVFTTYIPPSPLGELGIRVHGIHVHTEGGWDAAVSAQWIADGEESGAVTKILMGSTMVEPSGSADG